MPFVPAKRDAAQQTWIENQTTVKCNLGLLLQREVGLTGGNCGTGTIKQVRTANQKETINEK